MVSEARRRQLIAALSLAGMALLVLQAEAGHTACFDCPKTEEERAELAIGAAFAHVKAKRGNIPESYDVSIGAEGMFPRYIDTYSVMCVPAVLEGAGWDRPALEKVDDAPSLSGSDTSGDSGHGLEVSLRGSEGDDITSMDSFGGFGGFGGSGGSGGFGGAGGFGAGEEEVCYENEDDLPKDTQCAARWPRKSLSDVCDNVFGTADIVPMKADLFSYISAPLLNGEQIRPVPSAESEPVVFTCTQTAYIGLKTFVNKEGRSVEPIRPGNAIPFMPFEASMSLVRKKKPGVYKLNTEILTGEHPETSGSEEALDFVMNHFDKAMQGYEPASEGGVPRKIHWVWLGGDMKLMHIGPMLTSARRSPGWEFYLWTDRRDIRSDRVFKNIEHHAGVNINVRSVRDLDVTRSSLYRFYSEFGNYGGMSDMVRMEVLLNEGGVYLDADYLLYDSLDTLTGLHFFGGAYAATSEVMYMDVCVIGAKAGHPALRSYVDYVLSVNEETEAEAMRGAKRVPGLESAEPTFNSVFEMMRQNGLKSVSQAREWTKKNPKQYTLNRQSDVASFMTEHTGPTRLLHELYKFISAETDSEVEAGGVSRRLSVVLPPTYLFPHAATGESSCSYFVPEAFGLHMDTKTWMGEITEEKEKAITEKVASKIGLELL